MKAWGIAAMALLLWGAAAGAGAPADPGAGILQGQVCVQAGGAGAQGCHGPGLPDAEVRVLHGEGGQGYLVATTDAQGRFTIAVAGAGPFAVEARRPGFVPANVTVHAGEAAHLSLPSTSVNVTGTVRGPDGAPLGSAFVSLCGKYCGVAAAPDGSFFFAISTGVYNWTVWHKGYVDLRRPVVIDGTQAFDLVLGPLPEKVRLHGLLVDEDGDPIPHRALNLSQEQCCDGRLRHHPFHAYCCGTDVHHAVSVVTDGEGRYQALVYPQGTVRFHATGRDIAGAWGSSLYVDEGDTEFTYRLDLKDGDPQPGLRDWAAVAVLASLVVALAAILWRGRR